MRQNPMAPKTPTKKLESRPKSSGLSSQSPVKRRRLNPEEREREIVDGAITFFSEVGFEGSLRDLAERIGVTHQNLFRYFSTKEALIERVYKEVYLNRWQREWEALLTDPSRGLEDRLNAFYKAYFSAIYRPDWVRIFVFAGLKDVGITKRYLAFIQKKVIEPICAEVRTAAGLSKKSAVPYSPNELEIAWGLHGELFYLAIRKWVYDMPAPADLSVVIQSAVKRFLSGAPAAMKDIEHRR